MPTQGDSAHGNNLGVVTQEVHQLLGKHKGGTAHHQQNRHVEKDGKIKAFEQTLVLARTKIKATEGLVALPHPNDDSEDDECQPRYDGHAGNRGIAIYARCHIEHQRGNAGKRLTR